MCVCVCAVHVFKNNISWKKIERAECPFFLSFLCLFVAVAKGAVSTCHSARALKCCAAAPAVVVAVAAVVVGSVTGVDCR